jgi:hypothetical protein
MSAILCIGPRRAWTGPLAVPALMRCPLVAVPGTFHGARRTGSAPRTV